MLTIRRIIAFGLSIAALGAGVVPVAAVAADKPDVVRIGWFGGPRPWIIGKAEGMFEKDLGTKVQWVQFPSGAAALTALAAGEIDISRLGSSGTVVAIARKLPVKMIGISGVIQTSERLIAKEGIDRVADLKGKRVAYPPGSTAHYSLMAALNVAGVPSNQLTLIALKPAEMLAAWQRGDIDAAWVWGPFSHQMESAKGKQVMVTGDLQKSGVYVWNNYVARTPFADKHPEVVVQFLKTFEKTVRMYQADKQGMVRLIAKHLNQDEAAVADTLAGLQYPSFEDQVTTKYLADGGPIAKAMMDQAKFLAQLGDLRERDVPASFQPGIDLSFMRKAIGK